MYWLFVEDKTTVPWLYTVRRAGYNAPNEDFAVDRGPQYPYCNLHFIVEGGLEVTYEGHHYSAGSGDLVLLPAFKAHTYQVSSRKKTVMKWLEFHGSDSVTMVLRLIGLHGSPVFPVADRHQAAFEEILAQCGQPICHYTKSQLVYEIFMDEMRHLKEMALDPVERKTDPIERVCQYIEEHLGEALKVDHLSHTLGYSTSYLITVFKKTYGMTPNQFIYNRRIIRAKRYLTDMNLPLDVIAAYCGFYDSSHLIHRFKKQEGMTPTAYRKEIEKYQQSS